MATAVRRVVVFLLAARAVIGFLLVAVLVIGLVGLGGIANPSASHENRLLIGLCFEVIAGVVCIFLALYIDGRPTHNPRLNGLVLIAFGPSLIPFWSLVPFVKSNPAIGWSVVIVLVVCGLIAMVWPQQALVQAPTTVRGNRERRGGPVSPKEMNQTSDP